MDHIWRDIKAALQVCTDTGLPVEGDFFHFHVLLEDRFRIKDDFVLLPALLLGSWTSQAPESTSTEGRKVLVKLPLTAWYSTAKHCKHLRIFHCPLTRSSGLPLIDATWGSAVTMASPILREDTCLQAVELFAGGFCGWGQSLRILEGLGCKVKTRWLIDHSKDCFEAARMVHGGLTLVQDSQALKHAARHSPDPVFVLGDIKSSWWHTLFAETPEGFWCASPPCPPWSHASTGPGLQSEDGQLLLHLASMMQAFQPLCVCVEQVAGYRQHSHFDFVQSCFAEAGFIRVWHEVVDLGDFLPSFRRRYLAAWVRRDLATEVPSFRDLPLPLRPSLQGSRCVVELPLALKAPCLLAPETLSLYQDPMLLPPPVRLRQQTAAAYRVRQGSQSFSTIMASYHYQHELPETLLRSKGLLGALFADAAGPRFLSGVEAALCHGNTRPLLMHSDDSIQMRVQGNCLAVPQAAHAWSEVCSRFCQLKPALILQVSCGNA